MQIKQMIVTHQSAADDKQADDTVPYVVVWCSNDEVAARFEQLDADHNGVLSPDEVVNVLQETLGLDEDNARYMVKMFDTNKDGNLDKTEFMALWSEMFGQ